MKSEVARFEQERIEDFKSSLEAFLDGMITRQKDVREMIQNQCSRASGADFCVCLTADRGMGVVPTEFAQEGRERANTGTAAAAGYDR